MALLAVMEMDLGVVLLALLMPRLGCWGRCRDRNGFGSHGCGLVWYALHLDSTERS